MKKRHDQRPASKPGAAHAPAEPTGATQYPRQRKNITIRDIARVSGASLTTVSLVLNNRDGRISTATRGRVLDTVKRLGYRPSRLAQALQARRAGMLAVVTPPLRHAFADVYIGELLSAIHDSASQAGYKILLEVAHPTFIERQQHLELFDRRFVDGMLCIGVTTKDAYLEDLEDPSRPAVIVNNYIEGTNLNFIRFDYYSAGRLAAEHLLSRGHTRVGMIHGAREVQTSLDAREGFAGALKEAGLDLPADAASDGLYTEEGGAVAAAELVRRRPDLTALFAGNDKMAIGAMTALKQLGRRVPDDVSVVGCDDLHAAAFSDPPLTTVQTALYDLGQRACQALFDLIEGRTDRVREVRPVTLVVRGSTRPPRT